MKEYQLFDQAQIKAVEEAVSIAEELVSNYFKMSSSQWFKSRYDVRTTINLADHERVVGPFAQVVGYEARKKDVPFGSSAFNFYRVCLQDGTILKAVEEKEGFQLFPFVLYVVVHELVHVVRFTKFQQIYEAATTHETAMEEERKVHALTLKILKPVRLAGLALILEYYGERSVKPGFDKLV
ncbi:hypothetical protein HRM2_30630 [Desulforapulum autotrophicum HRM2]|uniref:Uncharacterized protein n=1 Tax=Desulforapulum autotrophicum (strain ATCC 43914 / DSM 3382 / VKM B-1955 / HRM2) TaxID=177437 RepID=C0QKQ6_DESAH|nr:hypothetical protein [Desulforapulum autotrophicum]ACN16146.1 hypothetical protein HRM2_30630 [Desulforapulum autotrophicum HRM2]